MKLKTDDGSVRVGDLWLDRHDDVSIVTEILNKMDVKIEVISGSYSGQQFTDSIYNFGEKNGHVGFFHTLLSRSLND